MSEHVHYDIAALEAADAAQRAALADRFRAEAVTDDDRAIAELTIALHAATASVTIAFTRALNAGVDIERVADQLGMGVGALRAGVIRNLARHSDPLVVGAYMEAEAGTIKSIMEDRFAGSVQSTTPMQGSRA